jgi:hypothetical protein
LARPYVARPSFGRFVPSFREEDLVRRRGCVPTRPQAVAGRRRIGRIFRAGRDRQRLVGWQERRFGLDQPDDAPRAFAGLGRAVQVRPGDRENTLRIGSRERAFLLDPGFDIDEAEPGSLGRSRSRLRP